MKPRDVILSLMVGMLWLSIPSAAQEPGWSPVVVARGDMRRQIQATPILERPYRPMHFYGNAVRRAHYRNVRNTDSGLAEQEPAPSAQE
jgi:hypothetical protein